MANRTTSQLTQATGHSQPSTDRVTTQLVNLVGEKIPSSYRITEQLVQVVLQRPLILPGKRYSYFHQGRSGGVSSRVGGTSTGKYGHFFLVED